MANVSVFSTKKVSKKADTKNRAGGKAYSLSDKAALAQYAVTGTFNGSYYTSAQTQFAEALKLAQKVSPEFLAQLAVYARKQGYMKDMPAFLLAVLATRDTGLFKQVFPQVIDNGKMLRNFVQIMRSGAVGRRSLGSASKKAIQRWFRNQSDEYIFRASVGNSPSLADVIKMVHPRPQTETRDHLYAYLTGRNYDPKKLPMLVQQFEAFKATDASERDATPNVPFQMLTAQNLSKDEWTELCRNGNWHFTRMNINTFERHGVFEDSKMVDLVASRLCDEQLVTKARVFPMQIMAAHANTNAPRKIQNALHDAMELAVGNIPSFEGKKVYVAVDSSGSMNAPATGTRKGATTVVRCKEVASLFAASIVRKNDDASVIQFTTSANHVKDVNPRDSILTMRDKIGKINGGTDLSSSLRLLNKENAKGDLVIILSDMESWADPYGSYRSGSTGLQAEWDKFRRRNPKAQLVCVNLVHGATAQASNRPDVLNIGGFSDQVFTVVDGFVKSGGSSEYWVSQIEQSVELN